jgi:hypothetical protein
MVKRGDSSPRAEIRRAAEKGKSFFLLTAPLVLGLTSGNLFSKISLKREITPLNSI